jgi:RNA polymerase sigma factor (sigma-70 family)
VGRRQTAEDVAQDVLSKVAATMNHANNRWDPARGPLRSWLNAILRRCVLNRLRGKHGPEPTITDSMSANGHEDEPSLDLKMPADGSGPPELAAFNELLGALQECIEGLSGRACLAVKLKFFQGLRQTEIAQKLGVSAPTVSRMFEDWIYPQLRDCLHGKNIRSRTAARAYGFPRSRGDAVCVTCRVSGWRRWPSSLRLAPG